ncbi:MAG: tRNA 2-thiocytidine(32) synthetase TtcA [Bacteroidota bacterium]
MDSIVSTPTEDKISRAKDVENATNKINREMGKAIVEFKMIEEGDKILIAVSGGKDSLCMLHFLMAFQKKAPINFELLAVNVDQKQPGFPEHILPNLFTEWGVPYHIEAKDTYSIVLNKTKPGKSFCSLCSRLRRGILYGIAREHGCNKIALGHHQDDLLETFMMNAFFSGQLASMPAHYRIEKEDLSVIRPLYAVPEETISTFVSAQDWPIIPCNLCGSQEGLKRNEVKHLLSTLHQKHPKLKSTLFGALHHPDPRFLFNKDLWGGDIPSIKKQDQEV